MRSYVNLPRNFELDAFFRAVGRLRASNLPGYQELDLRFGWQLNDRLEVSLIGRELLHERHAEFLSASAQPRYFQREVAVRVTWQSR
jgi:iron complex outermembrane receptor protein